MSIHLDVFLDCSKLPSLSEWAESISREGFPLAFPAPVDLTKHSGYLPVLLGDEESGFEFAVLDCDQSEELPDEVQSLLPTANAVAEFRFFEIDECHAAIAAAAVLANLTGGAFFDPQSGECLRGQEAIVAARTQLDAAAKKEADEIARHVKFTPKQWAETFEQTLRRVNTEYKLSKDYRGRLVECVREDATGLFLSQSCVTIHDSCRHCFAVLLTCTKLSPRLRSPFVLGSRFDHNATIAHAYNRDHRAGMKWHVAPREWHSNYRPTARNTPQCVEATARSAEQYLFPLYRDRLSRGAGRVLSLLRDASVFLEQWGVDAGTLAAPVREGELAAAFARAYRLESAPVHWDNGLVTYYNALRLADAHGFSAVRLLNRRQGMNITCDDVALATDAYTSIPDAMRNAAIFVCYIEDFLAVRDELPRMIQMIDRMQSHPTLCDEPPPGPQRLWWQFWA